MAFSNKGVVEIIGFCAAEGFTLTQPSPIKGEGFFMSLPLDGGG
jgi:hypothetical protein